jgi:hypothetical protein
MQRSIWLKEQDLEGTTYRWRCDWGQWTETEACFAYEPKTSELSLDTTEEYEQTKKHREYMKLLAEAVEINATIEYVLSGEAQKKFEEVLPILAQYILIGGAEVTPIDARQNTRTWTGKAWQKNRQQLW